MQAGNRNLLRLFGFCRNQSGIAAVEMGATMLVFLRPCFGHGIRMVLRASEYPHRGRPRWHSHRSDRVQPHGWSGEYHVS